jgi:hypothetical protein
MLWPAVLGLALGCASCKGGPYEVADAATSPQAKAEPTPLAAAPPTASASIPASGGPDAGPAPEPLRYDSRLPTDVVRDVVREPGGREQAREPKEVAGFALQAVVRSGEMPGPPRAPEVNFAAIEAAKRKAEARVTVEASPTRARFVFSGGFVLPQGTELRARNDWYGHLLLWPGEGTVRVVEPGALRALVGERRLDVAPLSPAEARSVGEGARRLNLRTRKIEVSTRAARATLEVASMRDSGDGGVLICRWLLDLVGASPSTMACATDEVPLRAELRWTTRGALTFETLSLLRRADLGAQDLATPPPSVSWSTSGLPGGAETLVPRNDIVAFRSAPADSPQVPLRDGQAPPPEAGLTLVNSSDELRVTWLDGAPIAWVAPRQRLTITTLLRGRYALQWRTFLGDAWDPPDLLSVPGTSEVKSP